MRGWKWVVLVALLLAATALKLCLPEQNALLRARLRSALEPEAELTELAAALGRSLRAEGEEGGLLAAMGGMGLRP